MELKESSAALAAREAPLESISALLASTNEEVLNALLQNPLLNETHVCLLLERKDLTGVLLEEIGKRRIWRASYRVRRSLAAHPHTPRLLAVKLLRDLYLMDLVRITLLPTSHGELKRLAEARILSQLPQLPLGQRITLAKQGSSRIAAGLVLQGPETVVRAALDNSYLTEAQLLKTLAKQCVPSRTLAIVANHRKWLKQSNIRVALLRHQNVPTECAAILIGELTRSEIEELLTQQSVPPVVQTRLCEEVTRRTKESCIPDGTR